MTIRPQFRVLLAMACGAPATIAALVLLWWPAFFGVYGMVQQPIESLATLALVAAIIYAIANYWLLASRTIKGRTYALGWRFWLAVTSALAATVVTFAALPFAAAVLIVVPVTAATWYFALQQRQMQSSYSSP